MNSDRAKAARELLAFCVEAGVDTAVSETPLDRFADPSPPPAMGRPDGEAVRVGVGVRAGDATLPLPGLPSAIRPSPKGVGEIQAPRAVPVAPPSPDAAVMAAREAARSAATLDDLRAILARF